MKIKPVWYRSLDLCGQDLTKLKSIRSVWYATVGSLNQYKFLTCGQTQTKTNFHKNTTFKAIMK